MNNSIKKLEDSLKILKKLSKKETVERHHLAASEEHGEVAKDLLEGKFSHAKLEAVDNIVANAGIFIKLGGTEEEFISRFIRSVKKWDKNVKKEKD